MRKFARRAPFFLCLLLAGIYFSHSQQQRPTYKTLLGLYTDAQRDYDSATLISHRIIYGPEEEQWEEALNASALKKFQRLFVQLPRDPWFDSLRFFTAFKVGELQHYFENYADAVSFYQTAIQVKKSAQLPDTLFFKPYLYAGIIYYNQNKFDSALQFFRVAESLQKKYNNRLQEGERLYNIVGVLYYERGNYRQAENYFQKAIEVLPPQHEAYKNLYVNYHINLAQIYLKLEDYDKANSIYQKLLPLNIMTNEIYHNIGSLNLSLGAATKALAYFRKVGMPYNKAVRLYNSMGNAFFANQQYDSASAYYQKAIRAYHALGKNSDPAGYGSVLKSLGAYALHFEKYDSALFYYQQALRQFYPSFSATNREANPETYSGVFSYINLFQTLADKAEAWHRLYQKTARLSAAQQELATYQSAFRLIDYVERTYESDEARLFLAKIKYILHSKPVSIAYALYTKTKDRRYLDALYLFDQQNKATALVLSRQISDALRTANSPLLQKEQELKSAITLSSIRAAQVTDSTQLAALSQSIRDNEIQLSKVQEQVNQHMAVKETSVPSIASLQKDVLDKETLLLSYHLSESKLTVLAIAKDSINCFQRDLPPNFYGTINAFLADLKKPAGITATSSGQEFYRFLFSGVPLQPYRRLIIIPDDVLNYLPFEALKNEQGRYLVEDFSVQYQYSSALLKRERNELAGAGVLSFAPFSRTASGGFLQLPNSVDEVQGLRGRQFFDTAATKQHFLEQCSAFPVLHLATHAVVNSQEDNLSYIAFSPVEKDHLLYAQEIYNLPLQHTQLVMLSACETASGQLVKGEGVMSLSRAFRYAGCANVITTLWKANDFSTAYLTNRIHHYLEKGQSIATAVQQAKKDYLADKTIHPRLKQPSYWSHLIFIGNIQQDQPFPVLWFAAGGLVLVLLLVFLLLSRKKSRKAGPRNS